MSSVTTAVAVAVAVAAADDADEVTVAADAVEKAPRRFPPPCWTQEEALTLIDAYRERWYALRRGYLRTADWDAVAAEVASRCPGASTAKTSAQCRHKMEKLRQRYRAEKQRALSLPFPAGRYFSSWFFFDNMEAMENGTAPPTPAQRSENLSNGSRMNALVDQNMLKLKLKAKHAGPESSPDPVAYGGIVQARRLNNSANKIPIQYPSYLDRDEEEDDLMHRGMRIPPTNRIPIAIPSLQSNSKKPLKLFDSFDPTAGSRHQMLPPAPVPGLRDDKFGSDFSRSNPNGKFVDPGAGSKYWASPNPNRDSPGLKRGRGGLEEVVASIKLLGEGFMKMEKEKMEMSREIEGMRMEMEMKRNQMLLESQKQIVDAFLKGLAELNKRKSKKAKSGAGVGVAETAAEP